MKRLGRKGLAILLAAFMAVSSTAPMQGMASNRDTIGHEETAGQRESEKDKLPEEIEPIKLPVKEGQKETPKEVPEGEAKLGAEGIQDGDREGILPPQGDMQKNAVPLTETYDINQPVIEGFELVENGKMLKKEDTVHFNLSAYDLDSGIQSIEVTVSCNSGNGSVVSVDFEKSGEGNLYTGSLPCDNLEGSSFAVTSIRVEDRAKNYVDWDVWANGSYRYQFEVDNIVQVSLSELRMDAKASAGDGKLRVGDTVTYSVKASCTGDELGETAEMCIETAADGYWNCKYLLAAYHAETQEYIATYTVGEDMYPSEWHLENIQVCTKSGKEFNQSPFSIDPQAELKFTVRQDGFDTQKPVIQSITLDKNGQEVAVGDFVTITVKVQEENPSNSATAQVSTLGAYEYVDLEFDAAAMEYTGKVPVTENTCPGYWELAYLRISDTIGHSTCLEDFEEGWQQTSPWYYIVVNNGYDFGGDTQQPVIESISLDKNGQWVQGGESLTFTVKVQEEHPFEYAYAYFYPQVANVSDHASVTLYLNESTMEYTGTIPVTEDTYPCEWALKDLSVLDEFGNEACLDDFQQDWKQFYPWYYKVKPGNTYREDVKNVTFSFYGYAKQKDGSFMHSSLICQQTVEHVGRRASLRELGITFPQPEEGIHGTWNYSWSGREIDEDTELLFGDSMDMSVILSADYQVECANISLTYMAEDSGIKTTMVPKFVERGTAYHQLLDMLQLPEDARTEGFVGFRLSGFDEGMGHAQVEGCPHVSVEAAYKDCQVAWNTRALGQDGEEISRIVNKAYLEGISLGDALAELEEPDLVDGLEFEAWALTSNVEEETISQPMASLDAVAVYRGKTTVDSSYTYRGENGEVACGGRMLLMDGENLTDAAIQGEATGAFKDVAHFKGLMLSEWTGEIEGNQQRYKNVQFQAVYYNCVAILKYPDGGIQYIVMDKGAPFTLPTENGKYTELLWDGCRKGETVIVTEDREFLAVGYQINNGTQEEPEGAKLSEEEIAKATEEIGRAEEGASITIDMKKATVVPKEVLKAIQGKPVDIVLDMGGYQWSISGADVLAAELRDIDLEVQIGTDAIPSAVVESIAGGKPATQLSLTHNGDFGFRAELTLSLGSENGGGTGSLYYYDSTGKLKFMDAGQIGEDGKVSLSFSHASNYVVVVQKNMPPKGEDEGNKEENGDAAQQPGNAGDVTEGAGNKEEGTGEGSGANGGGNEPGTNEGGNEPGTNGGGNGPGTNEGGKGTGNSNGGAGEGSPNQDGGIEDEGKLENNGAKDGGQDGGEPAQIKKKDGAATTDTGKAPANTAGTVASGKRKSPKTGE